MNDFQSFKSSYRDRIYETVCRYLPGGEPETYHNMVRTYVDRQGQYRRPVYLILWTVLYGGNDEDAILPAAAAQLSEDYFLMHDDWMDGNLVRRNGPAAHIMHGERYAILAGSHLQAFSWKAAIDAAETIGKERGRRYLERFYDIMHTTHEGQYLDINLSECTTEVTDFTPEMYYESIHAKAAYYSVYGPMQCGAIITGASQPAIDAIPEYGVPASKAFQLTDDVLDCTSTERVLGKSIGNDVRSGAKTLILWHAVQHASSAKVDELRKIYGKQRNDRTDQEIKWVLDTFKELGSIDYAQQEAVRLADEALKKLAEHTNELPNSVTKEIARNSIGYIFQRTH